METAPQRQASNKNEFPPLNPHYDWLRIRLAYS